jgi:CheY-like chemotaxis protein
MTTHDAAAARPLILVVDDVGDNREMYAEFLEYASYQVAQARTGVEALALAHNVAPALIVMDLSMPGMDGWEAARRLKADARTKSILVLVVSAHALRGTGNVRVRPARTASHETLFARGPLGEGGGHADADDDGARRMTPAGLVAAIPRAER